MKTTTRLIDFLCLPPSLFGNMSGEGDRNNPKEEATKQPDFEGSCSNLIDKRGIESGNCLQSSKKRARFGCQTLTKQENTIRG